MSLLVSYSRLPIIKTSLVVISLIITACQQAEIDANAIEISDDLGKITISERRVTVEAEHITHIKSERYQPSLSLYGRLKPLQQATISTPERIKFLQIAVEEGDKVEKDDILFTALPAPQYQTPFNTDEISITAPVSGVVRNLAFDNDSIFNSFLPTFSEKNQPILTIIDEENWQFISRLPLYTKSQLSVGQHVPFALVSNKQQAKTTSNKNNLPIETAEPIKLTGQIADIQIIPNKEISVSVHIAPTESQKSKFQAGMQVQGKVDFGQIEVGTLVAKTGVHPILTHEKYGGLATDLSVFTQPHAHVVAPVKAYVWIVNQDRSLHKQLVDVIRYHSQSEQYVVAGIPNEVLICLADLPDEVEGRLAHIS
ncbi:MAG: hypothetical protein KGV51_01945 [Moraxellaceae bacterium]|nr:hypothetical protein [Moraxellaceae bacterium]